MSVSASYSRAESAADLERERIKREQALKLTHLTKETHSFAYPATPSEALRRLKLIVGSHYHTSLTVQNSVGTNGRVFARFMSSTLWWRRSQTLSSKVDFVAPNNHPPLPGGFRLGEFSDVELYEWLSGVSDYGPSNAQNARVTSISWWSSHDIPWHHQFIVITVVHDSDDPASPTYSITFDRLGKLVGQRGLAKQQVTIQNVVCAEKFLVNCDLICALTNESFTVDSIASEAIPRNSNTASLTAPPATFGHVVTYMCMMSQHIPDYHVGKYNFYFFCRMLFHIMLLRHYSAFKFHSSPKQIPTSADNPLPHNYPPSDEASPARSILYSGATTHIDPTWTRLVGILKEREEKEGLLLYEKVHLFSTFVCLSLSYLVLAGGLVGGWFLSPYLPFIGSKVYQRIHGLAIGFCMGAIIAGLLYVLFRVEEKEEIEYPHKEQLLRKMEVILYPHLSAVEETQPV